MGATSESLRPGVERAVLRHRPRWLATVAAASGALREDRARTACRATRAQRRVALDLLLCAQPSRGAGRHRDVGRPRRSRDHDRDAGRPSGRRVARPIPRLDDLRHRADRGGERSGRRLTGPLGDRTKGAFARELQPDSASSGLHDDADPAGLGGLRR